MLTGVLADIARIAGLDAALAVVRARGGTRAYFPRAPGPDHWLSRAVGAETAALICRELLANQTGDEIDIPQGPTGTLRAARRMAAEMDASGASAPVIAVATGLTDRTVRRMRARRRHPGQGELW